MNSVYKEEIQQNYPDFFPSNRNISQNFIFRYKAVFHVNNINKTEEKKEIYLCLKSMAVSTKSSVKILVTFLLQARKN